MADTDIQWATKVWNATRGCSRVSPGCGGAKGEGGCYAEKQAARFSGPGQPYEGLVRIGKQGPRWTGKLLLARNKLSDPLHWRKHERVFVNSMSDLFHEALSDDDIDHVFAVMALCAMHSTKPSHDFLFLTKRSSRMLDYYECAAGNIRERLAPIVAQMMEDGDGWHDSIRFNMPWPLPNVWAGVSVEDQERANERIPDLLATPAAIRWVSYEPALGPVNFHEIAMPDGWKMDSLAVGTYTAGVSGSAARVCSHPRLDWLVTGGESGSGARQFGVDWAKDALLQCQAAAVPFFMKQFGRRPSIGGTDVVWDPTMNGWTEGRFNDSHGGDWDEWPEAFKVRQFPEVSS